MIEFVFLLLFLYVPPYKSLIRLCMLVPMWQYIKMTNFICQGSILLFIQSFTFTSSFYKLMSKQVIPCQCIYSYIEVFFNTCCENLSCHATTFIFLNTRLWQVRDWGQTAGKTTWRQRRIRRRVLLNILSVFHRCTACLDLCDLD